LNQSHSPALSILIVSKSLPGEKGGSAVVLQHLIRGFRSAAIHLAGEHRIAFDSNYKAAVPDEVKVHFIWKELTNVTRGERFLRWFEWLKIPLLVWRLRRIIRSSNITHVLAVYPSEQYLVAALLAARSEGIDVHTYFHNSYASNRAGIAGFVARKVESFLNSDTKAVFVLTEGLRAHYAAQFQTTRIALIRHTFVMNMDGLATTDVRPHREIRAAFLGNLNDSNLDAFKRICSCLTKITNVVITVFSPTPQWFFQREIPDCSILKFVELPFGEEIDILRRYDVLLLPHGLRGRLADLEYRTIFPTRTVTYLASGVPIFAHLPEDSILFSFLEEYKCAESVTVEDDDSMVQAFMRVASSEQRRQELTAGMSKAVLQFDPIANAKIIEEHLKLRPPG